MTRDPVRAAVLRERRMTDLVLASYDFGGAEDYSTETTQADRRVRAIMKQLDDVRREADRRARAKRGAKR